MRIKGYFMAKNSFIAEVAFKEHLLTVASVPNVYVKEREGKREEKNWKKNGFWEKHRLKISADDTHRVGVALLWHCYNSKMLQWSVGSTWNHKHIDRMLNFRHLQNYSWADSGQQTAKFSDSKKIWRLSSFSFLKNTLLLVVFLGIFNTSE